MRSNAEVGPANGASGYGQFRPSIGVGYQTFIGGMDRMPRGSIERFKATQSFSPRVVPISIISLLLSCGPTTAPNIRSLAELKPKTLAIMHGSSFVGAEGAIRALAEITSKRGCA